MAMTSRPSLNINLPPIDHMDDEPSFDPAINIVTYMEMNRNDGKMINFCLPIIHIVLCTHLLIHIESISSNADHLQSQQISFLGKYLI